MFQSVYLFSSPAFTFIRSNVRRGSNTSVLIRLGRWCWLLDWPRSRWLSPIGLAIACFGLFLLSQINAQSSMWDIIWRLAVTGFGQGLFQSPNTRTMMSAAPRSAQGEASGLLATGRVIGQSMSVALTGTVFAALGGATAGTLLASPQAQSLPSTSLSGLQQTFVSSFHAALLVCAT